VLGAALALFVLTPLAARAQATQSTQTPPTQATSPAKPPAKSAQSTPQKSAPGTPQKAAPGTPQKSAVAPAPTKTPSTAQSKPAPHPTDSATKPIIIMREVYGYSPDGRRDPFVSLLTTSELRPTISDLKLTGIFYDPPSASLASVHDASSNKIYSIRLNQALGRMRVVAIRPNVVVFSIEELGMSRRDSLFLRPDTSNTRFE
jgi:hypothetical protein